MLQAVPIIEPHIPDDIDAEGMRKILECMTWGVNFRLSDRIAIVLEPDAQAELSLCWIDRQCPGAATIYFDGKPFAVHVALSPVCATEVGTQLTKSVLLKPGLDPLPTNLQEFLPVGCTIPEEPTIQNIKPVLNTLLPVRKYNLQTDPQARMPDPQGGDPLPVQHVSGQDTFEWAAHVFDRHGMTIMPHATALDKVEQFVVNCMVTSEALCGSENRDAIVLVQHEGGAVYGWDS